MSVKFHMSNEQGVTVFEDHKTLGDVSLNVLSFFYYNALQKHTNQDWLRGMT